LFFISDFAAVSVSFARQMGKFLKTYKQRGKECNLLYVFTFHYIYNTIVCNVFWISLFIHLCIMCHIRCVYNVYTHTHTHTNKYI